MQSESIKELATALSKAQGVMEAAKKGSENPFFHKKATQTWPRYGYLPEAALGKWSGRSSNHGNRRRAGQTHHNPHALIR